MASARLVVLALFVVGCQSWKLPAVPAGRRAQFYTQQSDGAYKYGYDTAEGLYQEQEADSANEVQGKFGADGGLTRYTAGVGGFVVTAHKKPTSSGAAATKTYNFREATLEELTKHPEPVVDTPEVAAAKAKFQADYAAAAAAAEAAPDVNIITGATPVVVKAGPHVDDNVRYSGPLATIDAEGNVLETAEVKAAKAAHLAAYNAAAAAAAAAPDVFIIPEPAPAPVAKPAVLYSAPVVAAPAPAAVVRLDAHGNLQDTPEVAAAKAKFHAEYAAAAAAAEAAPDTGIITASAPAVLYSPPAVTVQTHSVPVAAAVKVSKPVEIAHVSSSSNLDGSYQFSYSSSDSSRHESADAANNVQGNFEFVADDAQRRRVDYSAGAETGFVASGSHLPVAVKDTAEVEAAKASFKSAYEAAAAAAEAAEDDPISYTAPVVAAVPQAAYIAPQPVVSTTYVAAKAGEIADYRSTASTDGSYQFSYSTSDSSRHESADAANNVQGNFEFVADDAQRRRVDYSAGAETGFVASGSHLPVAVSDTADVRAAKASFKSAFAAAAAAAEAAPDTDVQSGYVAAVPATVLAIEPVVRYATAEELATPPKPVVDTPEVAAAKAKFHAEYAAAAAAAAAAPDTGIITAPVAAVKASYQPAAVAHHGNMRTYSFDGITLMEADGALSPSKFGYSYQ